MTPDNSSSREQIEPDVPATSDAQTAGRDETPARDWRKIAFDIFGYALSGEINHRTVATALAKIDEILRSGGDPWIEVSRHDIIDPSALPASTDREPTE